MTNTSRTALAAVLLLAGAVASAQESPAPGQLPTPSEAAAPATPEDAAPAEERAPEGAAPPEKLSEQPEGDAPPEEVKEEVGVSPPPDARVPLDLTFTDESGQRVALGTYFGRGRPVLLNLVYFRCPSLCNVVLNEVTACLQRLEWTPGEEFDVVTVSINPQETANLARAKKAAYVEALGRPEAAKGWHFLTGNEPQIQTLADAVGFGFRFDTNMQEYAHSAALFVVTPDGRLSRTIYGAMYEPKTVRLSLVEAGEGQIGSPLDRLILYCYHYDPDTGVYTAAVMNIMRLAGVTTVLVLGIFIGGLWLNERRRAPSAEAEADEEHPTPAPSERSAS